MWKKERATWVLGKTGLAGTEGREGSIPRLESLGGGEGSDAGRNKGGIYAEDRGPSAGEVADSIGLLWNGLLGSVDRRRRYRTAPGLSRR